MALLKQCRPKSSRGRKRAKAYSGRWARLSAGHRRRNPLCVVCGRPSDLVDHITPLAAGGARLDPANLQSMCRRCHGAKTAQDYKKYPEAYRE